MSSQTNTKTGGIIKMKKTLVAGNSGKVSKKWHNIVAGMVIAAVSALGAVSSAQEKTYDIPGDMTLEAALADYKANFAATTDTGIFNIHENQNVNTGAPFILRDLPGNIIQLSGDADQQTVLTRTDDGRILDIATVKGVIVENLIVDGEKSTGRVFEQSAGYSYGGAGAFQSIGTGGIKITDSSFINAAIVGENGAGGAGLFVSAANAGVTAEVDDIRVTGNSAHYVSGDVELENGSAQGGGAYFNDFTTLNIGQSGTVYIAENSTLAADGASTGGGLFVFNELTENSTTNISNLTLSANKAEGTFATEGDSRGGGFAAVNGGAGVMTVNIEGVTVSGNSASAQNGNASGGGMAFAGVENSSGGFTIAITDSVFIGNTATADGGDASGGALYFNDMGEDNSITLTDVSFYGNSAVNLGSDPLAEIATGGAVSTDTDLTFMMSEGKTSQFKGNTVTYAGSVPSPFTNAIHLAEGADLNFNGLGTVIDWDGISSDDDESVVSLDGGGRLELRGFYAEFKGGIHAENGTLVFSETTQFRNPGTYGIQTVSAAANGVIEFNIGGPTTEFNPAVKLSGGGSLLKTGEGTLDLRNAAFENELEGGTTIDEGTIVIDKNGQLGDSGSGVTFDGGMLQVNLPSGETESEMEMVRDFMIGKDGGTLSVEDGMRLVNSGEISGELDADFLLTGGGQIVFSGSGEHVSSDLLIETEVTFTGPGTFGNGKGDIDVAGTGILNLKDGVVIIADDLTVGTGGGYSDEAGIKVNLKGDALFFDAVTLNGEYEIGGGLEAKNNVTLSESASVDVDEDVKVYGNLTLESDEIGETGAQLYGGDLEVGGAFEDSKYSSVNVADAVLRGANNTIRGAFTADNLTLDNDNNLLIDGGMVDIGSLDGLDGTVFVEGTLDLRNDGWLYANRLRVEGDLTSTAGTEILVFGKSELGGADNTIGGVFSSKDGLFVDGNLNLGAEADLDTENGMTQIGGDLTFESGGQASGLLLRVEGEFNDGGAESQTDYELIYMVGQNADNVVHGDMTASTIGVTNNLEIVGGMRFDQDLDEYVGTKFIGWNEISVGENLKLTDGKHPLDQSDVGAFMEGGALTVVGEYDSDDHSVVKIHDVALFHGKAVMGGTQQFGVINARHGLKVKDGASVRASGNAPWAGQIYVGDLLELGSETGTEKATLTGKTLNADSILLQQNGEIALEGKTVVGLENGGSESILNGKYTGNGFEILAGTETDRNIVRVDADPSGSDPYAKTADLTGLNGTYTGNAYTRFESQTDQRIGFDGVVLRGPGAEMNVGLLEGRYDALNNRYAGLDFLALDGNAALSAEKLYVSGNYSDDAGSTVVVADGAVFDKETLIRSSNFNANGITVNDSLHLGTGAGVDAALGTNTSHVTGNLYMGENASFKTAGLTLDGHYIDVASSDYLSTGMTSFGKDSAIAGSFASQGLETQNGASLTLLHDAEAELGDATLGGDLTLSERAALSGDNLTVKGNYHDHLTSELRFDGRVAFEQYDNVIHSENFHAGRFDNGAGQTLILEEEAWVTIGSDSRNDGTIGLMGWSGIGLADGSGNLKTLTNAGRLFAAGEAQFIDGHYVNAAETILEPEAFLSVTGNWTGGENGTVDYRVDEAGHTGMIAIGGNALKAGEHGTQILLGDPDARIGLVRLGERANIDGVTLAYAGTASQDDAFSLATQGVGKWEFSLGTNRDDEHTYWDLDASIRSMVPDRSNLLVTNIIGCDLPKHLNVSGPWARMKGGRLDDDRSTIDRTTFQMLQIGWDKHIRALNGNGSWFAGIFLEGDWMNGRGAYRERTDGEFSKVGSMKTTYRGNGTGLYLNRSLCSGWYVDVMGRINLYDSKVETKLYDPERKQDNYSGEWTEKIYTLAVELGKKLDSCDRRFSLDVYDRVIYTTTPSSRYLLEYEDNVTGATRVYNNAVDAWTNQLGAKFYWNSMNHLGQNLGNVYFGLDYFEGLSGDFRTTLRDVAAERRQEVRMGRSKHRLSFGTASVGTTFRLKSNFAVGGEFEGLFGDVSGWSATVSARYSY